MIEGSKWSQNETKLIYQIKFVAEGSKPDLYGLLEGMFSWRQLFKKFKIKALLVKAYPKTAQNVLKWMSTRDWYLGENSEKTNTFADVFF